VFFIFFFSPFDFLFCLMTKLFFLRTFLQSFASIILYLSFTNCNLSMSFSSIWPVHLSFPFSSFVRFIYIFHLSVPLFYFCQFLIIFIICLHGFLQTDFVFLLTNYVPRSPFGKQKRGFPKESS